MPLSLHRWWWNLAWRSGPSPRQISPPSVQRVAKNFKIGLWVTYIPALCAACNATGKKKYIGWQWRHFFVPYHIYASCLISCHDVWQLASSEKYLLLWQLSKKITGSLLKQLIQFYSNKATNLRHLTLHSPPLWQLITVTSPSHTYTYKC